MDQGPHTRGGKARRAVLLACLAWAGLGPAVAEESASPGLQLWLGRAKVAAASSGAVAAAVEAANAARRLDGLEDALNPDIVDPAKLAALLRVLGDGTAPELRVLAGRALFVDPAGLGVGTSAPTTVAGFAQRPPLRTVNADGDPVILHAQVPVECPLARTRAAEARTRLDQLAQEVTELEGRDDTRALAVARARRFAVARAWRDNAAAAAGCAPDDPAAQTDRAAADQAVDRYFVLTGGMP